MSLSEFLHMDGYAMYVWPAFVVTFVVLAANVATARRREAAVVDRLRRRRRALGGDA